MPRRSLSAGEKASVYEADEAGERVYLRVESGRVSYAKSQTFVRDGRELTADDRAADLQATEAGESLYVYAHEDSEISYERQGWIANLFSPKLVDVGEITTTSGVNIDGANIDVPTTVDVESARAAKYPSRTPTGQISTNSAEITSFTAPTDRIWVLKAIQINVLASTIPSSGHHYVNVYRGSGEVGILRLESSYNTDIVYNFGEAASADRDIRPSDATAQQQAPRGLVIDDSEAINFAYWNETDADINPGREYNLWVEEVRVQ